MTSQFKTDRNYRVEQLPPEKMHIARNLLQAYEAEFSAVTNKVPDADGVFPLDVELNLYTVYLLKDGDAPIGLALKGTCNDRHDIADFYIIPRYRGEGAGFFLASHVVKKYKGLWQARQIDGYSQGRGFAIGALEKILDGANFEEEKIVDPYWGPITIQYFESK